MAKIALKTSRSRFIRNKKFTQNIKNVFQERFGLEKPHIKVEKMQNPDLNAHIMAERLAYSLDRGRHYRRAGSYILRKIMDSRRALGAEIRIIGKFAYQKVMTQIFRAGTMAKNSQLSNIVINRAAAPCIQNSEVIEVIVKIHFGRSKKPIKYIIEEELIDLTEEDKNFINDLKENVKSLY